MLIPGGSATGGGTDYTLASATINIPAGTYSNTAIPLGLTITVDAVVEPDETIVLTLGSPMGDASIVAPASTTYTILNDDSYIASIAATDAAASESPLGTGTYTVSLDVPNSSG
ncbi:hypothetical protein, partial [Arenibacter sp. ARW7G5Y1]|uniref:hypothetical protein n=1 Tax=Arenibacter sp. ARW7G5Y1 TaxID=2135619 RepID=UPI0035C926E0